MARPEQARDPALRALLVAAHDLIRTGDHSGSVRSSAEAVRQLLIRRPDALDARLKEGGRHALPPFVGARLVTQDRPEPELVFERSRFSMAEAITWYEYALDAVLNGEP